MLQLNFNVFIERLKIQQEANKRSTVHYEEDAEKFTIYFKNYEYWEYYTIVMKSDIIEFGELYGVRPETALDDFKMNYLTHAVKLADNIIKEPESLGSPSSEITKATDPVVEEEAQDYEDFFVKTVDKWERKTIKAIENIEIEKMYTPDTTKTFGEFIKDMFNGINALPFLTNVRKFIKQSLVQGMDVAEEELNVNVAWSPMFSDKLKALEYQQLNGYTIEGKRWHGIRGATAELRLKILKSVEEDVRNKVGKDVMTDHIKDIFSGATTSQAKRIARTETNRFVNEGKLASYKDSGIKGKKAWSIVPKECCDICHNLHNKYFNKGIDYDEEFVADNGQSYFSPPAHPNCRCVVEYRPIK